MTKADVHENLPYLGIRNMASYYKCNLDCPYCISDWKKQSSLFDFDRFKNIIEKIKQLPYRVCLRLGIEGEIFTSPEILGEVRDICNNNNNIIGVSFSTNLVASWDKVIGPFIESVDTSKLGMGCTLHDTVIKSVDRFFEKVSRIHQAGVLMYVGYVAIPQRIKKMKQYKIRCEEIGVRLILNGLLGPIRGVKGANPKRIYPRDYTAREKAKLKKLWGTPHSYLTLVESRNTRGMACSAGKNYIYIKSNGDVFPCGAGSTNTIGNILTDKIRFSEKDRVCKVDRCWCGNENQALRIVDKYYNRTRTLRIFTPKDEISDQELYEGYNPSIFGR